MAVKEKNEEQPGERQTKSVGLNLNIWDLIVSSIIFVFNVFDYVYQKMKNAFSLAESYAFDFVSAILKAYEKFYFMMPGFVQRFLSWASNKWLMAALFYSIGILSFANFVKAYVDPVIRLFFAKRRPISVRAETEAFDKKNLIRQGYDFESKFLDIPDEVGRALNGKETLPLKMHYIDHVDKDARKQPNSLNSTVLLLHGEPTWSFVYRKVLPPLIAAGCRVVAPDFIGFGMSDKYVDESTYTHELHVLSVQKLIDELELHDITLVCHDWGGLVGLSVARLNEKRFGRLVIMNMALPTGFSLPDAWLYGVPSPGMALPFLAWRNFAQFVGRHLPVYTLMRHVMRFPEPVCRAYAYPFPNEEHRGGVARWPLLVPIYKDDHVATYTEAIREFLRCWVKPCLILFGDSDPITLGQLEYLAELMPPAETATVKGASHFLQETHGRKVGIVIRDFMRKSSASATEEMSEIITDIVDEVAMSEKNGNVPVHPADEEDR